MKLMKTFLAAAVSAAVATPALAVELDKPDFYGFLSAGALKVEGKDAEADAFEIELGLQGKVALEEKLNLNYAVEVDLAGAANSADDPSTGRDGEADIHVKEAKFWLPTRYGMFVVAPRGTSGQWRDIYGSINHYEYNESHADLNPDGIFAQPDRTSGTLAYHTPWFLNTKMVVAAITLNDSNKENVDGRSVRFVHKNGNLHAAIGTTLIMQNQLPGFATDDYLITAAGASYKLGGLTLGATWENNKDAPYPGVPGNKADYDSYGVSGYYLAENGFGVALGLKEKNHDYDAADNTVYTLKLEQRITPNVKVWAETGQYDEPVYVREALVTDTNYALGFNVTF